ncbi:hypothetical protein [Tropicimonas sp. IMCC6043]|uniref:hypothetical protein n=1 Tax=Tropicimonas sp. IMCC6043 TaxID=2510645 RepID=UPI00101CC3DF|nr:hypothetical protein [Tropicimonas sp. IMCC6043]RYH06869.1 hypothetical protein EU800_22375 [Tropicimonas sp. IMCC6043]
MLDLIRPIAGALATGAGKLPRLFRPGDWGKYMVVGLVMVSASVGCICAFVSLLLGGGWLAAFGLYLATGTATSFMLLLRLLLCEMAVPDDAGPAKSPPKPV